MSEHKNPFQFMGEAEGNEVAIVFALADFLAGKMRELSDEFVRDSKSQLEEAGIASLSVQQISTALMVIIGFLNSNAASEEYDMMEKVFKIIMDQTRDISLTPAPPTSADTIN
jgi:hypothetical protein